MVILGLGAMVLYAGYLEAVKKPEGKAGPKSDTEYRRLRQDRGGPR